ncbi:hypothetical protein M0L20_13540 [Spirosoma sp. RP8]|uniref:Uncharacterized protein n=1 Tax=Spirosoma liriopis TaxID=2937440 RepID=A0ABT0HL42_9BACT|nr:hypothetical protein [Spirosoma liriopis]MCK8492885.1 hypothetical protein [Spirosoma liriopis]
MSQTLTNIITSLAGQVVSFGLAAFAWQYIQERLKKIEDVDRRVYRLETREEQRKELGLDKPK